MRQKVARCGKRSKVYLEVMRIFAIILVVFCRMKVYSGGLGLRTYLEALMGRDNGIGRQADFAVAWFLYAYLFLMVLMPLLQCLAQKMRNRHYLYLLILQVGVCGFFPFLHTCCTGSYRMFSFSLPNTVWYGAFFMLMGYFVENRCARTVARPRALAACLLAAALCVLCASILFQIYLTPETNPMLIWSATACMATLPAIALYVLVRSATLRLNPAPAAGRILSALGAACSL